MQHFHVIKNSGERKIHIPNIRDDYVEVIIVGLHTTQQGHRIIMLGRQTDR